MGNEDVCVLRVAATFAESLSSAEAEYSVKELQEMSITGLQPRTHTLHVLAGLLTSDNPDLSKAASAFFSKAASYPLFRSKVSGVDTTLSVSLFLSIN